MSDETSVGAIKLGLEIDSELSDSDIKEQTAKMAELIKKGFEKMNSFKMNGVEDGMRKSLEQMNTMISEQLNVTKSIMETYKKEIEEIMKKVNFNLGGGKDYDTPVDSNKPNNADNTTPNARAPPSIGVKMPKIDLSQNTDVIKAQIDIINEKMRISTEQVANQRIALTRLESEYQKLAERSDAYSLAKNKFEEINATVNEAKQRIAQLKFEMNNVPSLKIGAQMLSDLTNLKMDLTEMEPILRKAEENLKGFGKGISDNALTSLEQKITNTKSKISSLNGSLSTHSVTKTGLEQQLENISNKALQASGQTAKVKSSVKQSAEGTSKLKEISKSFSQISTYAKKATSSLKSFGNVAKKVASFGMNPLSGMKKGLEQITKGSNKASKGMNGAGFSLGRLVKSFFVFSLVFPLVSKGIMALGQSLGSTLMTNETFSHSLDQIKSNLMAAFMPIYNAILPALNALMSALARVTAYIASFVSTIFGSTYQSSIDAAKGLVSAKDAMGAYGSAAKKAAKDANASVMSFDHLNKLSKDQDDSDSESGTPNIIPTEVDTSKVDGWAKKIKDMFKSGDYEGIGKLIGESINKGVNKITDFISWDNVGVKVAKFTDGFTRIFNSAVSTINWYNIGGMFGTGINTIANTLYLLITGINWLNLGNAFGKGINSLVEKIDWNKLGMTIGSGIQSLISILFGLVTTIDWGKIGSSIATGLMGVINSIDFAMLGSLIGGGIKGAVSTVHNFVTEIDWTGLGKKIASTLNNFFSSIDWADIGLTLTDLALGLLDFVRTAIAETDWFKIGDDIATALVNIDWFGIIINMRTIFYTAINALARLIGGFFIKIASSMWDGLCSGIEEFFSDPGAFLKTHVVDPIVTWVKALFGIHSPSTVFAEIGGFLIQGLMNGISNLIPTLLSNIGNWLGGLPGKFLGYASSAISSFCEGIKSIDVLGVVKSAVGGAVDWLGGLWKSATTWGSDMMSGLASGINGAANWVSDAASGVAKKISSWLHFSRPDVGPLHEYEKWMPDFMLGLSETMKAKAPVLYGTIQDVSSTMSNAMQNLEKPQLAFAGSTTVEDQYSVQNNGPSMSDVLKLLGDIVMLLKSKEQSSSNGVTTQEIILKVGDTELARVVIAALRKYEKETGKKVLV